MEYINYTTSQGETWSSVAWKMYASMQGISLLVKANPGIPLDPVLPERTNIVVPILSAADIPVDNNNVPPWKR
ncbi:MAG: tail protein X [Prevotella sp.]|nr:tail protein X [Prevotella sp.]